MEEYHYFVAHEFSKQEMDDLRYAIETAFEGTGLKAYYADLEMRQSHILEKIRDMILKTQFGIFDISNPKKPNVFLELGLAIAAEQPFYIICRKGTDIPADLAGLDRIEYESYLQLIEFIKTLIVDGEIEKLKMKQMMKKYSESVVLEEAIRVYHAGMQGMHHALGVEVVDNEASNSKSWYADSSVPCPIHLLYGPYEDLPSLGKYSAFFKLKIDKNSDIKGVLHVDVISNRNPSVNSNLTIRGIQFDQPKKYQIFRIDFIYKGEKDMEYRVIKLLQERHVWIDYVAIVKCD